MSDSSDRESVTPAARRPPTGRPVWQSASGLAGTAARWNVAAGSRPDSRCLFLRIDVGGTTQQMARMGYVWVCVALP